MKIEFDFDPKFQDYENEAQKISDSLIELNDGADWKAKIVSDGNGSYEYGCEVINARISRLLELSEALLNNYPVSASFRENLTEAMHAAMQCFDFGTILSAVPVGAGTVFSSDLMIKAFSLALRQNIPEMFEIKNGSAWVYSLPWPTMRDQQDELLELLSSVDDSDALSIRQALTVNAANPVDLFRLLGRQEPGYFSKNPGFFGANFDALKKGMQDGLIFIPKMLAFFEFEEIQALINASSRDERQNVIAYAVEHGEKNSDAVMEMYGIELNLISYIERTKYTSGTLDIIDVLADKLVRINNGQLSQHVQIQNALRDLESPSQRIHLLESILETSPQTISNFIRKHSNVNSIPRWELLSSAKFKKYREENFDQKDIIAYFVDIKHKEFSSASPELLHLSDVSAKLFSFMQMGNTYYVSYLSQNKDKFPLLNAMGTNISAKNKELLADDPEFNAFCRIADSFYFSTEKDVLAALDGYLGLGVQENGKLIADFLQQTLSTRIFTCGFDTNNLSAFLSKYNAGLSVDFDSLLDFKEHIVKHNHAISEPQLQKIVQSGKLSEFYSDGLPQHIAELVSQKFVSGLTRADKVLLSHNTTAEVLNAFYARSNADDCCGVLFDYFYNNGMAERDDFVNGISDDMIGNIKLTKKNMVTTTPMLHLDHLAEKHAVDKIDFKIKFYKSIAKMHNWCDLNKIMMQYPEIREDVLSHLRGLRTDELEIETIQKLARDMTVNTLNDPSVLEAWNLIRSSPNDMDSFFDSVSMTHSQMKNNELKERHEISDSSVNFDISI